MYINIDFKLTEEMEQQIKDAVREEAINLLMQSHNNELKSIINRCVKNELSVQINNLLQGRDFKRFLAERIGEQIGYVFDEVKE